MSSLVNIKPDPGHCVTIRNSLRRARPVPWFNVLSVSGGPTNGHKHATEQLRVVLFNALIGPKYCKHREPPKLPTFVLGVVAQRVLFVYLQDLDHPASSKWTFTLPQPGFTPFLKN